LDWETTAVTLTANEALGARDGRRSDALEQAKEIIEQTMANGPVPAREVEERLQSEGITRNCWRNAKRQLHIVSEKRGQPGSARQEWFWVREDRSDEAF